MAETYRSNDKAGDVDVQEMRTSFLQRLADLLQKKKTNGTLLSISVLSLIEREKKTLSVEPFDRFL